MAYVVTDNCIRCKHTDCVEVCPVDCFHAGPNMLVIDPEECIDCDLCVPVCPVDAIFAGDDVPEDQMHFFDINAKYSIVWPVLTIVIDSPVDADKWDGVKNKYSSEFNANWTTCLLLDS